ncbi:MAG: class I tRNA ligase family protein, partial [Clostridiales bacterium]
MNIFIGGAWPYANGSLHIGQIAGLLNGDIIARYYRIKGDKVCYVSGSDCYGTPISLRAKKEGIKPDDIVNRYHSEFVECFKKLGFSYDIYSKTIDKNHEELVNSFLDIINKNGYLYEKSDELPFCNNCNRFLPDRFLKGICYVCGKDTRGDQCDYCGTVIEVTKI